MLFVDFDFLNLLAFRGDDFKAKELIQHECAEQSLGNTSACYPQIRRIQI